jgi:probable phosphoglycerate mutase
MTELIFIRHGETQWNIEGRVMGQLDSPLSRRGEKQALAIARRLSRIQIAALYSSDLGRALQTANAIANKFNIAVRLDKSLRERNMGVFQGLTREEKKAQYAQVWKESKAIGADFIIPGGGESRNQRLARSIEVMNRLADNHPNETIVVVSHDGILRGFLGHILGLDVSSETRIVRANASYNSFLKEDGQWRLKVWGDTSHLQNIE